MEQRYSWAWVEEQTAQTMAVWHGCEELSLPPGPRFGAKEQRKREKAYDRGLRVVQREARRTPRTADERLQAQQRIVDAFPRFAAIALGLEAEAVELLTGGFLPVGTQLARWTRVFDPRLAMEDTIQACRNAWTACGLQGLLGRPMELTPSILAYSLLYPYSDNYLDHPELSRAEKVLFSERFRERLRGHALPARNPREAAVWTMVQMIEEQYPRALYPRVFDSLLAIHRAQEDSLAQLNQLRRSEGILDEGELLRISCAKGGTSVLADACLARPQLTPEESRFSFEWGALLQLGDDLQDVREDLRRGSLTLFTGRAAQGEPLDSLVRQLLHFSRHVAERMNGLPNGTVQLKELLSMSWRSLILTAVANIQPLCTPEFLAELETCSSFRFDFLRARDEKLTGRNAVYATLFDAFLEAGDAGPSGIAWPSESTLQGEAAHDAGLRSLSNSFA